MERWKDPGALGRLRETQYFPAAPARSSIWARKDIAICRYQTIRARIRDRPFCKKWGIIAVRSQKFGVSEALWSHKPVDDRTQGAPHRQEAQAFEREAVKLKEQFGDEQGKEKRRGFDRYHAEVEVTKQGKHRKSVGLRERSLFIRCLYNAGCRCSRIAAVCETRTWLFREGKLKKMPGLCSGQVDFFTYNDTGSPLADPANQPCCSPILL